MDAWHSLIETIRPHVVKIETPNASGTGFLVTCSEVTDVCGIATAAHVAGQAHRWENPIKIHNRHGDTGVFLRPKDRAVMVDPERDTAVIVCGKKDIRLPDSPLELSPEDKHVREGVEVGWLGFPVMSPHDLCFFSGRISAYANALDAYLVDGVAINGVSGSPAFFAPSDRRDQQPVLIGAVSAYIPNRATGETLPGLCKIENVTQFQETVKSFKSVDEAKKKENSELSEGDDEDRRTS